MFLQLQLIEKCVHGVKKRGKNTAATELRQWILIKRIVSGFKKLSIFDIFTAKDRVERGSRRLSQLSEPCSCLHVVEMSSLGDHAGVCHAPPLAKLDEVMSLRRRRLLLF